MAIDLDHIVPWGRSRDEYLRMFALVPRDLADGVLDCGGGPASFTAEVTGAGFRAMAVDPLYTHPGEAIRARFNSVLGPMLDQVRATPADWTWTYHRDPDHLAANRRTALERFLADYDAGRAAGRYRVGQLPDLALAPRSFGLALCSHLLFLYSDLLSQEFHVRSALELCRLAPEVRIFPLLTLRREPSPHLGAVREALHAAGWRTEVRTVSYELQRGGNQMLRVTRI